MARFYLCNPVLISAGTLLWPGDVVDDVQQPAAIVAIAAKGGRLYPVANATVAEAAAKATLVKRRGGSIAVAEGLMQAAAAVADKAATDAAIAALPSGGASLPPLLQLPVNSSASPEPYLVVAHCAVQTTFTGAFVRFYDSVVPSDSAYASFLIYDVDAVGGQVGLWVAIGTTQLTGDNAFDNDPEAGIAAYKYVALTNVDGPFTIAAGHSVYVEVVFTGTFTLPKAVLGLLPA